MLVENPEVTLDEESHLFPKEALETAQLDWALVASVNGDDGNHYWFNIGAMSLREKWGNVDFWAMSIRSGHGSVIQPAGSIYKIADFPKALETDWHFQPRGALKATRASDHVAVNMGDFNIVCTPAKKTWQYSIQNDPAGLGGEWTHQGNGFPTWYGKEKPQTYTPHCVAYGYFWAGTVEGTLNIQGKKVGFKGAGVRERYYAVDTCPAEVGAWHDWFWFHFDELSGAFDEMKYIQHKDMSIYLTREQQFIPEGDFEIMHSEWAYYPHSGVFIPTRYDVVATTTAGVLRVSAQVVNAYPAGGIRDVPDSPTILLDFDNLRGTFTFKDGREIPLSNGLGGTLIRQWRPYPSGLLVGADVKGSAVEPPRI